MGTVGSHDLESHDLIRKMESTFGFSCLIKITFLLILKQQNLFCNCTEYDVDLLHKVGRTFDGIGGISGGGVSNIRKLLGI